MKSVLLVALLAALPSGHAANVVIRRAPVLKAPWKMGSRLASWTPHTLTFAVREQGMDRLKEIARDVSNPASPNYARYLTTAEIDAIVAPAPEDVAAVTDWLSGSGVISVAKEMITLETTVGEAEALLGTTFHRVRNTATGQTAVRAGDVRAPARVGAALQSIYGAHGLPLPPRPPRRRASAGDFPPQVSGITPDVLKKAYNVSGVTPSGSTKNRQAVAEFQGQQMVRLFLFACCANRLLTIDRFPFTGPSGPQHVLQPVCQKRAKRG